MTTRQATEFPEIKRSCVPTVDTEQMIEVDRLMMEDYRIDLVRMMENAGRALAHLARARFLDGDPANRAVVVMAGGGGNGGGALVAARRLAGWGANVVVGLGQDPNAMAPVPAYQLSILQRMGVQGADRVADIPLLSRAGHAADIILDGLIGYSLRGDPSGTIGELIVTANAVSAPVLSLDAPSGVDTATGAVHSPAIDATATMTLALPKAGLFSQRASDRVGELYLADISVPPVLYAEPSLDMQVAPLFARSDIVRVVE